jgi:phage tail protein X
MTVRDAEKISRKIAYDKVRKHERMFDPDIVELEEEAQSILGARVMIESKEIGGKIAIDFIDDNDLRRILNTLSGQKIKNSIDEISEQSHEEMLSDFEAVYNQNPGIASATDYNGDGLSDELPEDKSVREDKDDDDMYSVKNFTI